MDPSDLLQRIERGNTRNISFADFSRLLVALGFELERVRGSHHIYRHSNVPVLVNIQPVGGEVKAYQVRQVMRAVREHRLQLGRNDAS